MWRPARLRYLGLILGVAMAMGAPAANAALFRPSACTDNAVLLDKYLAFTAAVHKYPNDLTALGTDVTLAEHWIAEADAHWQDAPTMMHEGEVAVQFTHSARAVLDRLEQDATAMKNTVGLAFGKDQRAKAKADAALAALDKWLKEARSAVAKLNHAALAYSIGARAFEEQEAAKKALVDPLNRLGEVGSDLIVALAYLTTCKDAAQPAPPMSPSQIGGISGGGGSQRASAHGFSVLAPRRVRLNERGRTWLPLTITQPAFGQVEVKLTRGGSLITYVSASMGAAHGAAGLLVRIPRTAHAGTVTLTVVFTPSYTPGKASATRTIRFTLRLI